MWLDSSFQTTHPSRLLHTAEMAIAVVGVDSLVLYSHKSEEKQRFVLWQIPGAFCRMSIHGLAGLSRHGHGHTWHLD